MMKIDKIKELRLKSLFFYVLEMNKLSSSNPLDIE